MIRVIKVGGSLFDWPPLAAALQNWINDQPPAKNVLLAGGGEFAEAIRRADRLFSLGAESSHWLSIEALRVSTRLLAAVVRDARLLTSYQDLVSGVNQDSAITVIFDPSDLLRNNEPQMPGKPLPRSWSVTSDSIAARLAQILPADELVLLKSTDPPQVQLTAMAAAGYIDSHLPKIATLLPLRFVNLRKVGC